MKIEKECPCCGAVYSLRFDTIAPNLDEDQDEFNEDSELYPEFCPFCGCHESEEEGLEDDE